MGVAYRVVSARLRSVECGFLFFRVVSCGNAACTHQSSVFPMKIQCPCGTKYAFDITPDMADVPVRFVCQACGLDISEPVNQLIRDELGRLNTGETSSETQLVNLDQPSPSTSAPLTAHGARIRVHVPGGVGAGAQGSTQQFCLKHPGYVFIERCLVCQRPMCEKCMELFGYVCSPLCKAKADAQGIELPVYEHQRDVVQAKFWRKVVLGAAGVAVAVLGLAWLWFWYAWFGSVPRPKFSIRFEQPAYAGKCRPAGKDQLVILHGGKLARYDLKAQKEIWSQTLIDPESVRQEAHVALDEMQAAYERLEAASDGDGLRHVFKMPSYDEMLEEVQKAAEAALTLYVAGVNVWVASPGKLTRYDWESGRVLKEIPLGDSAFELYPRANELVLVGLDLAGRATITHLDLVTGELRLDDSPEPKHEIAGLTPAQAGMSATRRSGTPRNANQPMDPGAVAARAQRLPIGARLALPALVAAGANQQRALAELNGDLRTPPAPAARQPVAFGFTRLVPDGMGFVRLTVQLMERRFVERRAMKDRPVKSALDSSLTAAASAAAVNEVLNEIQRERGGGTIIEDASRYQVSLSRGVSNGAPDWTGEVIGSPELYTLQTVNVLASSKMITVFDKTNKKLWEAKLDYDVPELGLDDAPAEGSWHHGHGPCVERGGTLYVIDLGTVSAFDLGTGRLHWQIPTVGTVGMFFDDEGMLYLNTTTASHKSLDYPRQIDITETRSPIVLKVEPRTGKRLWTSGAGGWISCITGKYIYTIAMYQADDKDTGLLGTVTTGLEIPSHVRIRRINPHNGSVVWEHYQSQCPLDVHFDNNCIHLLFRKELQVLKFVSL